MDRTVFGGIVVRNYPDWLRAYMALNEISEAPDIMHFWAGVVALAGAVRRNVFIDMVRFQWTPNFYLVLAAPPGVCTKSTAVQGSFSILRKVSETIPGICFGPQSLTWQYLYDALQEAHQSTTLPNGDVMYSCPLTCDVSELGTFLETQDERLIDALTDFWDGQKSFKIRGTRSGGRTALENPWLNWIGATTPRWLQRNITRTMIGGGLMSRILIISGRQKERFVAYPKYDFSDAKIASVRETEKKLIDDMIEIAQLVGELEITKDAQDYGRHWYTNVVWANHTNKINDEAYEAYRARKYTHVHKLAIILSASARSDLVITKEILENAVKIITATEQDMLATLEISVMPVKAQIVEQLIQIINAHGKITVNQLWRYAIRTIGDKREFDTALSNAVQAGKIDTKYENNETVLIARGKL